MKFEGSERGRDVCRALEKCGWQLLRTAGSHRVFGRATDRFVFAFLDSDDIGPAMLNRIAKKTGISPADF